MKEKTVLIASLIIATMVLMTFAGTVSAWEYSNSTTKVADSNNLAELFGPRLDRVQIQEYANEAGEYSALAAGTIDLTDWPLTKDVYTTWTDPGYTGNVVVSHTGADFSMYIIDMRLDNRSKLDDGVTNNPAYTWNSGVAEPFGNPLADVWLRRAIATTVDRDTFIKQTVSGGSEPYLLAPEYTPCDAAYGSYVQPEITPTGALKNYTYVTSTGFGGANIAWGNAMLDAHGYGSDGTKAHGAINGQKFGLDLYYRSDNLYRNQLATIIMQPLLQNNPPNGLGLNVNMIPILVTGARATVMTDKKGHMYTGGWGLTIDADHLYYLFNIDDYWSAGQPPNYMYYPGDDATFIVPNDGKTYYYNSTTAGWPVNYDDGTGVGPTMTFEDNGHALLPGTYFVNPGNYWSWQMMIATDDTRAQFAAWRTQEFLAYWVCGVPVYANNGYAAYSKVYVGNDNSNAYYNQPWMGVVNGKAFGVWTTASPYNMHPANANWGTGIATNITMRWGFRSPTQSLNPIYAEWVWDWYVMNNCYDSMIGAHPYTLQNTGNLALSWDLSTWDGSSLGLGTCSKITFYMRHDLEWSDGVPLTSSDVAFTWGGPSVPGSISNLLASHGDPPAYWSGNLADILSVATPDPWTVIVYLDVHAYFALHSMSGFNYVLPQHIWQPIILAGTHILDSYGTPNVCSGGWLMQSTQDPASAGGTITLMRNPLHNMQHSSVNPGPMPLTIFTAQISNATSFPLGSLAEIGSTHWIWPKAGQTGVDVTDTITIDSSYYYTTGATIADVFPFTMLTGLKNVTLWKWTGNGLPSDTTKYTKIGTNLVTNEAWAAGRNVTAPVLDVETVHVGGLVAGYYMIKVEAMITNLEVSTDNGAHFTTIDPGSNPFDGLVKTYYEWCVVTARFDIGGKSWKQVLIPTITFWQTVSDLSVDGSDLIVAARAFGSYPGQSRWSPASDITGDFTVDGSDLIQIARNFGWGVTFP